MKVRNYFTAAAMLLGVSGAHAATDTAPFSPSTQLNTLQPQADRLATSISAVVQSAETSSKGLSSTEREAAIQSAIQGAITTSGDDPHVVLSTLQAFSLCPTSAGRYSVTLIPVTCTNLKTPLSPEAREAIASLEKVIVALVDQAEAPGALSAGGIAPFVPPSGSGNGGGGKSPSRIQNALVQSGGEQGTSSNPSSSIAEQPGPGGGGTSGYNTN